jgi:hypothetical protein
VRRRQNAKTEVTALGRLPEEGRLRTSFVGVDKVESAGQPRSYRKLDYGVAPLDHLTQTFVSLGLVIR